ncbi:hypothetical protein NDK50_31720 [Paraburkholderia bryophila]|uniref:hypothetical protein n=1 Tax=Paraburkholderia bryophila TaxID=420952 RepID=UPI00234B79AB|nr:hypothetical protein [Paraburkholderia bryophila]WCM22572.1 hypothetical protein NDK50_31720 [Paraburkholderia bryophila]
MKPEIGGEVQVAGGGGDTLLDAWNMAKPLSSEAATSVTDFGKSIVTGVNARMIDANVALSHHFRKKWRLSE